MRDHAIVSPRFWTGETGRFLRKYPDAQRLALYLLTCPSSNMIGLYYLPIPTICHELNMTSKGASEALRRVLEGGFAAYDDAFEVVFVFEMARFQIGERLTPNDNRIKSVQRQVDLFRKSKFYEDFMRRYATRFCLTFEAPSKPLESPFEGGLACAHARADQGQGINQGQEQEQDQGQASGIAPVARSNRFDEFYSNYPRKENRSKAESAWKKLNPSPELSEKIIAAVESQKQHGCLEPKVADDGRSVIPHPATWLNNRRWEDTPLPNGKPRNGLFPTKDEQTADRLGGVIRDAKERLERERQQQAEYDAHCFGAPDPSEQGDC